MDQEKADDRAGSLKAADSCQPPGVAIIGRRKNKAPAVPAPIHGSSIEPA
jgi:hypothetical protein